MNPPQLCLQYSSALSMVSSWQLGSQDLLWKQYAVFCLWIYFFIHAPHSRLSNNCFLWFPQIYITTFKFRLKCTIVYFHNSYMPHGLFMTSRENENRDVKMYMLEIHYAILCFRIILTRFIFPTF